MIYSFINYSFINYSFINYLNFAKNSKLKTQMYFIVKVPQSKLFDHFTRLSMLLKSSF